MTASLHVNVYQRRSPRRACWPGARRVAPAGTGRQGEQRSWRASSSSERTLVPPADRPRPTPVRPRGVRVARAGFARLRLSSGARSLSRTALEKVLPWAAELPPRCRDRSLGLRRIAIGLPPSVARPISAYQRATVRAPLNLPPRGLLTEAIAVMLRTACMQGNGRRNRIRLSRRSVPPSKRAA